MKTQTRRLNYALYLPTAILLLAAATTVWADSSPEPRASANQELRISTTIQKDGTLSRQELQPLLLGGSRNNTTRSSLQQKLTTSSTSTNRSMQSVNTDFWFYDAQVDLYSDLDRDGYFYEIKVTFDADTIYTVADVYAVIYLSYEFGAWNELIDTDDFTIYGASGDDEYFIETELVSGYPTGSYDVLIELFDTYDGSFVASIGPEETSELSYLPLEDAGRDTPYTSTTVVVTDHHGGGAVSWIGLLALFGVVGLLKARRV